MEHEGHSSSAQGDALDQLNSLSLAAHCTAVQKHIIKGMQEIEVIQIVFDLEICWLLWTGSIQ